jgi:hypothetical protein
MHNYYYYYYVNKVYIDAADPAIITGLKQAIGKRTDYEENHPKQSSRSTRSQAQSS